MQRRGFLLGLAALPLVPAVAQALPAKPEVPRVLGVDYSQFDVFTYDELCELAAEIDLKYTDPKAIMLKSRQMNALMPKLVIDAAKRDKALLTIIRPAQAYRMHHIVRFTSSRIEMHNLDGSILVLKCRLTKVPLHNALKHLPVGW